MKKIITLATVASLVSGVAFSDVTVGLQNRTRANGFSTEKKYSGKENTKSLDLKGTDSGSSKDYVNFKASTDFGGAVLESIWDNTKTSAGEAVTIDNYYGWINFGLLKFTAGVYDSRYTNRFNSTVTEDGVLDTDFAKFGLSNKIATGLKQDASGVGTNGKTWLYDFGNVADLKGGNNISFLADYTVKDVAGGELLLKGGVVTSDYDKYTKDANTDDEKKFEQKSGYVAEVAWANESFALDFIFKNPENKAYGAALYGTYNINKENSVVAGVTFGTQKDVLKNAIAVDGRYKYSNGTFAATLIAKYSTFKADKDGAKSESALEIGTELSYVVNENITVALDGRLDYLDLDNNDESKLGENTVLISPRARFSAGPNASITTAVEYTQALNASDDGKLNNFDPTKYKVSIPVIFRVKL